MTILEKLSEHAKERVYKANLRIPRAEIQSMAMKMPKGDFEFEKSLSREELSFICECKKASPSKGIICPDFPYMQIAKEYEEAGADCISVLTEPKWFLGDDKYLKDIAESVSLPCIRKDFTVDEYMIYEAKLLGASAVLLICSILTDSQLKEYISICNTLGMSALVEAHDEQEIESALKAGAKIIGINNRNLKDFSVDTNNSIRLRRMIPEEVIFVSESGVSSADDICKLQKTGVDAVLIGEALMRADNKTAKLKELRSKL